MTPKLSHSLQHTKHTDGPTHGSSSELKPVLHVSVPIRVMRRFWHINTKTFLLKKTNSENVDNFIFYLTSRAFKVISKRYGTEMCFLTLPCWTAERLAPHSERRTWSGSTSTGSHSRLQTWSCGRCRRSARRPGERLNPPPPWPAGSPSPCSSTTAAGCLWRDDTHNETWVQRKGEDGRVKGSRREDERERAVMWKEDKKDSRNKWMTD